MEYLTFGPTLHRRRREFLCDTARTRSVLILGDGDGRFLAEFLRHNTNAVVDSVERSRSMTHLAAARIANAPNGPRRVRQLIEDAGTVQLPRSYDLVVTHFFLDCFTTKELERLIPRITAHLHPRARWIISEFQIPSSGLRRQLARLVIKLLYLCFGVLTGLKTRRLPDYHDVLESNGYIRTASKAGVAGMLVSELWQRT
jgi:SAM-dependent methyltransferase